MGNSLVLAADASDGFMIHGITKFHLFGQELWITTTHVSVFIIMVGLIIFAIAVRVNLKDDGGKPGGLQNVAELAVEMLDKMVEGNMGRNAAPFKNYLGVLFLFILFSNISGLLGLRPPTADYGVTMALGLMSFCIIQFNNIKYNKFKAFTDLLDPIFLTPINIIGEIATPFSMSLRLFGNVLSGTVMMGLIYGLLSKIAIGWPGVLHIYFDLFSGCIQTYVFCMLTMVFTNNKIEAHR